MDYAVCPVLGIHTADNDSTGIHAITSEIEHLIIKVDDTNHTKKGVMNQLYKVTNFEDPLKELKQNKGDAPGLAKTLTNIPYHAHNIHDNCGEWCGYKSDKKNYNHSSTREGFQSPELFEALKRIFDQLAKHADRFSSAASSQESSNLLPALVYCDLESSGFGYRAEILQGAFKYDILTCMSYITPLGKINEKASEVNKLNNKEIPKLKEFSYENLIKYAPEVSKILGKTYHELSMISSGDFNTNFPELTLQTSVEFLNNTFGLKMLNKQTETTKRLETTIDAVFLRLYLSEEWSYRVSKKENF
ncbi:hypothetical protein PV325_001993 [Microctonus aethiopoides]|nr:hypothetical protein PV325_001993 [Microctonus aethiopoides]